MKRALFAAKRASTLPVFRPAYDVHATAFSSRAKTASTTTKCADELIEQRSRHVCSGSWLRKNAVAWRSDRMDHLSDCEFVAKILMRDGFRVDLGKQF